MDALDEPPSESPNDRTAAYDPSPELFASIPDPEASLRAPEASPPAPEASAPPAPVVQPPPPLELPPAAPRIPDPRLPDRSTAFMPAVTIDPALARRMRPPTRKNLVRPAAAEVPEPARPASKKQRKPAAPPERARPEALRSPPPEPPPAPEAAQTPADFEEALPSVVYAPGEHEDNLDGELTGIYEPPKIVELPRGRLVIVAGENVGKAYYLNRPQVTVGRATDNDVVLLDIAVSRKHLRIDRHAEGFRLVDLQSGNGTIVNGRRATECELYDGDRVEVGNSILDFSTVGRPRRREGVVPVTDPNVKITPPLAVKAGGRAVPVTWLLLWFGTTLAAVLLGVFVARLVTGDPAADDVPVKEKATAAYERASAAIRTKDWKGAEEELKVARQLAPDLFDYAGDLARVERARAQAGQIEEARRLLGEAQPDDVRAAVKSIGADSPYHAEAAALVAEADRRWLDRQVGRAEALFGEGKRAAARAIAEEVLARDAANVRAKALVEATGTELPPRPVPVVAGPARVEAAPAPAAPRETDDRRVKADVQEAMRLYRAEKFSDSAALLDRAAKGAADRDLARRTRDRAKQVTAFADAWSAATRAERGRRTDEAIEKLERALDLDGKLGGAHKSRLTGLLADQYYLRAIREFSRQAYDDAMRANDRVLALAPGHALGGKLAEKMLRTAEDLLRKARAAKGDDDDKARRLARQAQSLSRRTDQVWKDARDFVSALE